MRSRQVLSTRLCNPTLGAWGFWAHKVCIQSWHYLPPHPRLAWAHLPPRSPHGFQIHLLALLVPCLLVDVSPGPLGQCAIQSPLRSFVTSSTSTHIAFRLWMFIALSPGCGAEHDMQGLASGARAFGSSLAFGPHIRVLTAEATPRLLVAVTAQSRISNPFPQGKHLLIML